MTGDVGAQVTLHVLQFCFVREIALLVWVSNTVVPLYESGEVNQIIDGKNNTFGGAASDGAAKSDDKTKAATAAKA